MPPSALNPSHPAALTVVQLLGILASVAGIPTIQLSQQAGRGGQIAIALLEFSAAVAFVMSYVNLVSSSDLASAAAVSSASLGVFTIRLHRFPTWVG